MHTPLLEVTLKEKKKGSCVSNNVCRSQSVVPNQYLLSKMSLEIVSSQLRRRLECSIPFRPGKNKRDKTDLGQRSDCFSEDKILEEKLAQSMRPYDQ